MLKKLVKYGNSNALVLDKALLELLDIQEGSMIKITTDGTSLILSPVKDAKKLDLDSEQSLMIAMQGKYLDKKIDQVLSLNNISLERHNDYKTAFELMQHNIKVLSEKYNVNVLYAKLATIPEYVEKEKAIYSDTSLGASQGYFKALKNLQYSYIPELKAYDDQFKVLIEAFDHAFPTDVSNGKFKDEKRIEQEKAYGQIMGEGHAALAKNAEFQEAVKALAAQYDPIKQSVEYMEAYYNLTYSYVPEMKQAREALAALEVISQNSTKEDAKS